MWQDKENISLNRQVKECSIRIFRLDEAESAGFGNYQRYDFYQILWLTKSEGNRTYFLDFNEYTVSSNQIVLIFPGRIDKLDIGEKDGYVFAIDNDTFFRLNQRIDSGFLNGYFSNVFVSPDTKTTQILEQLMKLILGEYYSENRAFLVESYFGAFLFHISSVFEQTEAFKNKCDVFVATLMRLIDSYFIGERETDFYARRMGVSCKKVNELCKRGTGRTVKQHLQDRLILEIKKEIRLGDKNLKEIAFNLGFNEPAYFTRFFKQHTAVTPTDFRDNDPFVQVKGR
ncbi:AraC family transcriptional regulator [Dysgonomonas sp. 216]|uniref:helix-turn-helix domain-containing protein n=1 Tax=Dysgonomonas sp. 216 TaxID=2302934 RepID=UPI0013D3E483|nr:AraC family transcriptional regulator [Dysgonomonas sp. 216]